jgi:hypothetical protein
VAKARVAMMEGRQWKESRKDNMVFLTAEYVPMNFNTSSQRWVRAWIAKIGG